MIHTAICWRVVKPGERKSRKILLHSLSRAKFYRCMITEKWRHDMQEGYVILNGVEPGSTHGSPDSCN